MCWHGSNASDSRTRLTVDFPGIQHRDMFFDVRTISEFLSASTTLFDGTVILTGTPEAIGMAARPVPRCLQTGDQIAIGIG